MKFFTTLALALLVSSADAAQLNAMKKHHHHHRQYVQTLPDVREETPSESDIAASELARANAAQVKKNPQASLLASIKLDLDQINKDVSFGVSFSQNPRNTHAKELAVKISNAIQDYSDQLVKKTDSNPNETLTEQNAHNIAQVIFYDVQLQDYMTLLGMPANSELNLSVNRLKSLQKLYLFEQKGGENYLD